jgi:hypothetical protein
MRLRFLFTLLLALIVAACAPLQVPTPEPSPQEPATSPPIQFTAEPLPTITLPEVQMTPMATSPLPVDPGARELVEAARADLAARLKISAEAIGFVEFAGVVWPDGSLGCPQPGLAYPQVIVEGFLIRLTHEAETYHYHGGEGRGPFLCENPKLPLGGSTAP